MKRLDDWRARLAAEMDRQRREAFAWGWHDCATGLACGVVEAITGADLAAEFRGKYKTPAAALRIMRERGAETLGDLVAQFLPECPPGLARIGDIGVVAADGPVPEALCVFDASFVVVMTEAGHGHRPRKDVIRAFRVG